ncbi:MAG: hypothetical protein M3P93_09935 [Actinomycetota bacterium]|nr:hypothetical protein [Actinomycetota bacterium]
MSYAWSVPFAPVRFRVADQDPIHTPWWMVERGLLKKPAVSCGPHN